MAKKAKNEDKNDTNCVAVKGRLVHYNINRLNRYDGVIGQPKIVTCTRIPVCHTSKEEATSKSTSTTPQSDHSPTSSPSLSSDEPHYSVLILSYLYFLRKSFP